MGFGVADARDVLAIKGLQVQLLSPQLDNSIEEIEEDLKNNNILSEKTSNRGGQFKYDHSLILKLIDLQYTTKEISNYIGCSADTVKAVGSKYKHSIRKANIRCIYCIDENNNIIKYCFGGPNTARWLYNDKNYTKYSLKTLEDMIVPYAKKCLRINGILLKIEELPSIESIINNEEKIKELKNLLYIK